MENFSSNKIGNIKTDQISINEVINFLEIQKIINSSLSFIKNEPETPWNNILIQKIINKKKYFPITRQIELFIQKNRKNLKMIAKYVIFRHNFYLCSKEKINLGYPPYLLIELVSTCNLKCPFCFQTDKTFTRKPFMGQMSFELFVKIVDEAESIGIGAITFGSRGEPTMHKRIIEMIKYLGTKKNFFEKKLITNATKLNKELIHELFKSNFNIIQISADHYIKKDYEELRVNSNFDEIVKNVDNLFKIRNESYTYSMAEIRVSGIDSKKNLDREKFKNFWIKRSDHVSAGYALERWNTYENEVLEEINQPCEQLWDRMYAWYDGKVNPCDADYKSYLSYGDLNKSSIKDIWNSSIIQKTRQEHLSGKRNKINPCDRCGITFEN
jgi:radical SAM protein with 4Fe4S-binding SPASM domain